MELKYIGTKRVVILVTLAILSNSVLTDNSFKEKLHEDYLEKEEVAPVKFEPTYLKEINDLDKRSKDMVRVIENLSKKLEQAAVFIELAIPFSAGPLFDFLD